MIGHYLLTLTPGQEDRVLTTRLAKAETFIRQDGCRCLIGVSRDMRIMVRRNLVGEIISRGAKCPDGSYPTDSETDVGIQFDDLCDRFGEERVNAAIRNRILQNQARRTLVQQPEAVHV